MRRLAVTTALLAAGPALAHEGAHLHPHGLDGAWLVLSAALAGVAAGALGMRALSAVRARRDAGRRR